MPTTRKKFIQQTAFAIAGSCLPFTKLFAEQKKAHHVNSVDTRHPMDCTKDLRNPLFTNPAYLIYADFTYHKGTYPGVIQDVLYKLEPAPTDIPPCVPSSNSVNYCDATDHHNYGSGDVRNDISVLRYRAYYRKSTYEDPVNGHDYDSTPLPCVVMFHAGGFSECFDNTVTSASVVNICQQLCARGYIAITVDYRGGRLVDNNDLGRTAVQQQLASYKGIQDGRGAIRSIIKRNVAADKHGNRFRINENQFFVGGLSAGGVIALGTACYRSQAKVSSAYTVDSSSLTIEQALGHINADYYYGEPGDNLDAPTNYPIIRGVLNCWGGIVIPKSYDGTMNPDLGVSESSFFSGTGAQINPPMIGFAGALDTTIPFEDNTSQNILNSRTAPFKSSAYCLTTSGSYLLKDPGTGNNIYVKQCSAQNMYYILKELNRFTELYVDCNMQHGINNITTDNFGVNASNTSDVYTYIAIRTAIFFQTIMNVSITAAFPPFGYRGKSLFRSTDDTSHITNQRTCTDCDGVPETDTCNLPDDPACP